jgi:hypothetical protein
MPLGPPPLTGMYALALGVNVLFSSAVASYTPTLLEPKPAT